MRTSEDVVNMIFAKFLETLPSFSGNRNDDVNKWLEEIAIGFQCVGLNDEEKVALVHTYVTGEARMWLIKNMAVLGTWSDFVESIKSQFSTSIQTHISRPVLKHNEENRSTTMIQSENGVLESFETTDDKEIELLNDVSVVEEVEGRFEIVPSGEVKVEFVHSEEVTVQLTEEMTETAWSVDEETNLEDFSGFITPSLENKELRLEPIDDNTFSPLIHMPYDYDNVFDTSQISSTNIEQYQQSKAMNKTCDTDSLSVFYSCDPTQKSICLWYLANGEYLWYNLLPRERNDWHWFRTLTVP